MRFFSQIIWNDEGSIGTLTLPDNNVNVTILKRKGSYHLTAEHPYIQFCIFNNEALVEKYLELINTLGEVQE